jgi:glutamate N-acetyltransferase / amino-acid N-acetyltransferase
VEQRRSEQGVTTALGYAAGAVACGIKESSMKLDLAVLLSDAPAAAAGVFTQNKAAAAPVLLSRDRVRSGAVSAIVANSGNANACTGPQGLLDAKATAQAVARRFAIPEREVLVFSTGVIGVPMPMERVVSGIQRVAPYQDGGPDFAQAIMTTDTRRKSVAVERSIGDILVRIGGSAKGAGMIHPNMATLLGFITTDARVDPAFLQATLVAATDRSFNMISVDGDTSTNDAVVVLANGRAGGPLIGEEQSGADIFAAALLEVCTDLAKQLAQDGEGARTLIEIRVDGARDQADARRVARTISASNLVKTAVFGGDPNWGRIICAAGYAGAEMDLNRSSLFLEDLCLFRDGTGCPYSAEHAAALLRKPQVTIRLTMGLGQGSAVAWTCDMSYDYVRINAEYTT